MGAIFQYVITTEGNYNSARFNTVNIFRVLLLEVPFIAPSRSCNDFDILVQNNHDIVVMIISLITPFVSIL
jgi:hypothetical protein